MRENLTPAEKIAALSTELTLFDVIGYLEQLPRNTLVNYRRLIEQAIDKKDMEK